MVAVGRGGRIVTIASGAGIRGIPGRSAYGATKAGVINMTSVMAAELGLVTSARRVGEITVNCIAPGPVESDLTRAMHTAETRSAYVNAIPLSRYGTAAEIAAATLFLSSEEASYVNGHTLVVDGGMSMAGPLFDVAGMAPNS
jgi:NAD(P)-dependent dehydrogenase (short-subunit alcohol dehydrogenase family)